MIQNIPSEFILSDPRKDRGNAKLTTHSLMARWEGFTNNINLKDKVILDLGCANAAFGYLSLEAGCKNYTGVEVQNEYYNTGTHLLKKYYPAGKWSIKKTDITSFFNTQQGEYDIVFACGVIYGVFDIISLLKNLFKVTKETLIIESVNPLSEIDSPAIEVTYATMVDHTDILYPLHGIGFLPNFKALALISAVFGFEAELIDLYLPEYNQIRR